MASALPNVHRLDPLSGKYVAMAIAVTFSDDDTSSSDEFDGDEVALLGIYSGHIEAKNRPSDIFDGPPIDPWIDLQPHVFKERCRFFPEDLDALCLNLQIALDPRGCIVSSSRCVCPLRLAIYIVLCRNSSTSSWGTFAQQVLRFRHMLPWASLSLAVFR